ncbi:regulator of volume decrease after cellular swelling-domain-containing protein [Zychaea mexicana]|uniref:regulator of volume decrease after cellular swelling-domain-containing protein n=1 Tax=Zychaea mexicana TaxID=64656 RepID=UPI0022FF392D|nr:regulator of volume decrease after cellular swelling-domain-containing protein [Zychaea mexicana]KAI9493873.1 regulator of volume decrease after cellular swelling-domain-containing protein [Zychaea mexicana]
MTVTLLSSPPDLSDQAVRHTQCNIDLLILPPLSGVDSTIQGELNVCESQVYFYSESAGSGIAVEYPDIIIHAISRQDGRPSIYCQLEAGRFFPNQQLPEDEEEREDVVTELKFMPQDPGALEAIYMAMSTCAALHPDEDFLAEQKALEEENDFFADPSDETELNEVQQAALRHLESVFVSPAPQQQQQNGTASEEQDQDKQHQ